MTYGPVDGRSQACACAGAYVRVPWTALDVLCAEGRKIPAGWAGEIALGVSGWKGWSCGMDGGESLEVGGIDKRPAGWRVSESASQQVSGDELAGRPIDAQEARGR
jgi:hypothetical protein